MVTEFQRLPSFLKISGSAPDGVFLSPYPLLPHLWAAPKKLIWLGLKDLTLSKLFLEDLSKYITEGLLSSTLFWNNFLKFSYFFITLFSETVACQKYTRQYFAQC